MKKLDFNPSDIEKLYKDQVTKYIDFANESFSWKYIEKPLIENALRNNKKKTLKILDAGCGIGRTLKYLIDSGYPKNNIFGVDISEDMVSIAKKNNAGVNICKGNLTKYNPKEHFDLILCTHVLHYLNDKDFMKVLRNFYSLLNKGGMLFFVLTHPVRTTRHNLSEYFKNDWIVDHTPWGTASPLFLRTVSKIVNNTIDAGFIINKLEEPNIPTEANTTDSLNYLNYSCCPSRIAVLAIKQ